jgi:hypothetical protein
MGQVLLTIPDDEINVVLKFIKEFNPKIKIMFFNDKTEDFREIGETNEDTKPAGTINWALPGRPATDEEFEKMIADAEAEEKAGLGMAAEEAQKYSENLIDQWRQNHK